MFAGGGEGKEVSRYVSKAGGGGDLSAFFRLSYFNSAPGYLNILGPTFWSTPNGLAPQ